MVGSFGWMEILVITGAIIIFMGGGNQLPDIASSLGKAIREFKKSANPDVDDINDDEDPVEDSSPEA